MFVILRSGACYLLNPWVRRVGFPINRLLAIIRNKIVFQKVEFFDLIEHVELVRVGGDVGPYHHFGVQQGHLLVGGAPFIFDSNFNPQNLGVQKPVSNCPCVEDRILVDFDRLADLEVTFGGDLVVSCENDGEKVVLLVHRLQVPNDPGLQAEEDVVFDFQVD